MTTQPAATLARALTALSLAVAVLAPVGGCAPPPGAGSGVPRRAVVGIVTNVQGSSPTQVTEFTLRTADGETVSFRVGTVESGGEAFPPGHLREHQANAEPVRVTFVETAGIREAVRLEDAP